MIWGPDFGAGILWDFDEASVDLIMPGFELGMGERAADENKNVCDIVKIESQ